MEAETLLDAFQINPAIVALLCVVYLLYRLIVSRDATIAKMVIGSQEDIARQTKIITLLEILVQNGANFRAEELLRPHTERGSDGGSG